MKQQLIAQAASRLAALGVTAQFQTGTDISIHSDFFDANWGIGSKKIVYEAYVFCDERDTTVYMFEKTTEESRGINFGGNFETSHQQGKTLYRRVKGVRYGPDGQAFEYDLNLGAITSAVEETAKQFGWRFKTVLKREKALYPVGYIPTAASSSQQPPKAVHPVQGSVFCTSCGAPVAAGTAFCAACGSPAAKASGNSSFPNTGTNPTYNAFSSSYSPTPNVQASVAVKSKTWWLIISIVLTVLSAVIFALMDVSVVGWVLLLVVSGVSILLYFLLREKGAALGVVLLIVSAVLMFLVLVLTVGEPNGDGNADSSSSVLQGAGEAPDNFNSYTSDPIPMASGGGTMTVNISTEDNKYVVAITVTVPKSILPDDFLEYYGGQKYQYQGYELQDHEYISAFLCGANSDTFYTDWTLGPTYSGDDYTRAGMTSEFTAQLFMYANNVSELKELTKANDMVKIFRFRCLEVGIFDFTVDASGAYTYVTDVEKGYNLHPPIGEGTIPWDDILASAGLN